MRMRGQHAPTHGMTRRIAAPARLASSHAHSHALRPPSLLRGQCNALKQLRHRRLARAVTSAAAPDGTPPPTPPPWRVLHERNTSFTPGAAFYRSESMQARDLAVLAAAVHKRSTNGRLHVLDAFAGSGVRGARYVVQAGANVVWANDHNPGNRDALVWNLGHALRGMGVEVAEATAAAAASKGVDVGADPVRAQACRWAAAARVWRLDGLRRDVYEFGGGGGGGGGGGAVAHVSHADAGRLLSALWLAERWFDLIDLDSFGADTQHLGAAMAALRHGGLLYLTSTDGIGSAGKRPERSLGVYGAYPRALPGANEQGLRMLIGAAAREGAARGLRVAPLFSLFSYHGPVFRVMVRVTRSRDWLASSYGFVSHCHVHGESRAVGFRDLGRARCECRGPALLHRGSGGGGGGASDNGDGMNTGGGGAPLAMSGPMWIGALHDADFVRSMAHEAAARGWAGGGAGAGAGGSDGLPAPAARRSKNNGQRPLEELLELLMGETDPALPPYFTPMSLLGRRLTSTPPRDALIDALRRRGHAASRCHVEARALRSSAALHEMLSAAVEECGCELRPRGGDGGSG